MHTKTHDNIKKLGILDIVLIIILLISAFFIWKQLSNKTKGKSVTVSIKGKDYGTWALPAKPETLSISNMMKIEINKNGVKVLESSCPRKICIKHGLIKKTGEAIICAPNRIIVKINGRQSKIDALTQ